VTGDRRPVIEWTCPACRQSYQLIDGTQGEVCESCAMDWPLVRPYPYDLCAAVASVLGWAELQTAMGGSNVPAAAMGRVRDALQVKRLAGPLEFEAALRRHLDSGGAS
jgi:hypothetical protein